MAAKCGCSTGYLEHGFVATSNCKVYTPTCHVYCEYYCSHGYAKTASSVYCAGNDQWVPTGTHPSHNAPACSKGTDLDVVCDHQFLDNGYIVTCPTTQTHTRKECFYHCFRGYRPTGNTVYCSGDGWVTTESDGTPCVSDGTMPSGSTSITNRPFTSTTKAVSTTPYHGYYDDPDMKMDIQPMIFVGAVIGGILILGVLVFALFFRAHKKSSRENRRRAAFIACHDPLSSQNDYTSSNGGCTVDESEFRDIARRIIDQSTTQQSQNLTHPPPYEAISATSLNTARLNDVSVSVPPYTNTPNEVSSSTEGMSRDFQHQFPQHIDYDNSVSHNRVEGRSEFSDKPPPYEYITDERLHAITENHELSTVTEERVGPPPPYTKQ